MKEQSELEDIEKFLDIIQFPFSIGDFTNDQFLTDLIKCVITKNSLIQELLKVIPKEYIFKFLYTFAGQKLTLPDVRTIYNTTRDLSIYYKLKKNNTAAELANVASQYKITNQMCLYAYARIKAVLET